jgi:hypothetical protein
MTREQGFGCMGWSAFYKTCSDEDAVAVFEAAVSNGVTLFNTATFYGPLNEPGFGTNLRVLKKCLATVDRSKIQIMCKICMDTRVILQFQGKNNALSRMIMALIGCMCPTFFARLLLKRLGSSGSCARAPKKLWPTSTMPSNSSELVIKMTSLYHVLYFALSP